MPHSSALVGVPTTPQATAADLAAFGFLARYRGGTRDRYEVTVRLLFAWLAQHGIPPLEATRPMLEMFGRHLEEDRGNCASTVANHLTIVRGLYRFAVVDGYIQRSPAAHIRMPRVYDDESSTLGLDRLELGALIQHARASHPSDAALVSLMGLLGLRVSEAVAVRVEDYAETLRGHRVLHLVGKGGKPATIPVPVPVLRSLDAAAAGRAEGVLCLRSRGKLAGTPHNRASAAWTVERLRTAAGIEKAITPHSLRHSYITAALDAGVPLRDVQIAARHSDPRTTTRYDRARNNLDRHAAHIVAAYLAGAA